MRIIHFLNHTRCANGHVELAVDLACEHARRGHCVAVASGPGHFDDCLQRHGVTLIGLPDTGRDRPLSQLTPFVSAARRYRADIVNAHMVTSAVVARAAQVLGTFRLVTTVHNSFDRQAPLMGVGQRVIAVNEAVAVDMARRGIPRCKIRTVRNGTIGGKRRPQRPAQILPLRHPAIVTVAGLQPRKGVADLIAAFEQISERFAAANLYIVGDGPFRAQLQAQAAATRCAERMHFLGFLSDPREALASADVFVLASHAEPFGLVILEAHEMGCAVIATNVGGIPEVLGHGKNGLLVPPRDPAGLAAALAQLLADETRRQELAEAARADLWQYTIERMASETLAVYDELL